MVSGSKKRPRVGKLVSDLDRKVKRLLHDYMMEEQATTGGTIDFPRTSALIEYLREVDRSLCRQKELSLEKSIQRILPILKQQQQQQQGSWTAVSATTETSDALSSDGEPDIDSSLRFDDCISTPTMQIKNTNAINGSLVRMWGAKAENSAASISTTCSMPTSMCGASVGASNNSAIDTTRDAEISADSNSADMLGEEQQSVAGNKRQIHATSRQSGENGAKEGNYKRNKRPKGSARSSYAPPEARLCDLGGVDSCIEEILELIVMPLKHPEIYIHTGVQPPRGVLLHGPPGCGKTLLANAIAGEVGMPFIQISAPSIVSGMSGESEKKLRELFDGARDLAPCIVFIDEIDAITPKRDNAQRGMEQRIVAQMLTCIDDLSWDKTDNKPVMLIGATNRPDSLDPALRRAGRFDREIAMSVPDEDAREQILKVLCEKLLLSDDFNVRELAKRTPGYVGADLTALTTAAGMIAVKRIFNSLQSVPPSVNAVSSVLANSTSHTEPVYRVQDTNGMCVDSENDADEGKKPVPVASTPALWDAKPAMEKLKTIAVFLESHPDPLTPEELAPLAITNADFLRALSKVQPSAKREGFATVPGVTWDDIGALSGIREELRMAVVEPIRHSEIFAQVGITAPAGVLLWGPPGNGKTLLAKAIASESHTNFISVKGGELMSKYVGDSERAVRQVFARARASSPCVIFFDELDALCSRRTGEQNEASARVVNTLLTEIDGMEARKKVFIIAATNRPDIIDPAMLRPGRLDKLLYVELPLPAERADILRTLSKKTPLAKDVDLDEIAFDERCSGFSGADLAGLVREASVSALRFVNFNDPKSSFESFPEGSMKNHLDILVTKEHFNTALSRTSPSVSAADMKRYESLRKLYGNN
ncbi:Ribosome biogenesis ATPase rix7 [Coemansia spiralis]|uniref:Ribosome biogenesis ATPase rix7 n=2 Tax=Coemansia TaxID=4863 RepID=A0A9W8G5B0_9FUNG|nr:P-loop containing nucleoside triphosphate hydrolase protein [Coemansia spiralis]KAJ1989673.1 Ribosome biogenesis ATPase rix7 [Coemansia umbellata]KAJ2620415.1 Ribosome biogenesis ATPase rix7 [Coemansia sp. RSA 1358]KAJ2673653.1 Ribosome biogenesis ATPase rix7 [Coemansia spiralis]